MNVPHEIQLEKNETVKYILLRKYQSFFFPVVIAFTVLIIIVAVIASTLMLSMFKSSSYFGIMYPSVMFFVVISLIALMVLALVLGWFYVKSHKYIITNKRIIIYKKFVSLSQRELTFSRITDLLMNVGLFGRIFGYGTIIPVSGAMETIYAPSLSCAISGIPNPSEIFETITALRLEHEKAIPVEIPELEIEEQIIDRGKLPSQIRLFPNEKIVMVLNRKYFSFFFSVVWFPIISLIISLIFTINYSTLFGVAMSITASDPEFLSIVVMLFMILPFILWIITVIGVIALILGYFYTRGHLYLITDQRIIMIRIFIIIRYRELDYEDISDLVIFQGPFGRIFKYGNCRPLTLGMEFGLSSFLSALNGIPNPHEFRVNRDDNHFFEKILITVKNSSKFYVNTFIFVISFIY
ncbi:MAG: PH domain-containing protein [Candidatus Helarchaeota archaeon]